MRLIDADELKEKSFDADFRGDYTSVVCVDDIDTAPTIDAVKVVRCRDCKWYAKNNRGEWYGCWLFQAILNNEKEKPKPNDYCSLGENMDLEQKQCTKTNAKS